LLSIWQRKKISFDVFSQSGRSEGHIDSGFINPKAQSRKPICTYQINKKMAEMDNGIKTSAGEINKMT
jgi:hypothetical protein